MKLLSEPPSGSEQAAAETLYGFSASVPLSALAVTHELLFVTATMVSVAPRETLAQNKTITAAAQP
jgi:hypothetical protein